MLKFLSARDFISANPVMSNDEFAIAREYIDSDYDFGDFEVKYAYFPGALIIRYYSDEAGYHFEAPIPLSEGADLAAAYLEITEYCKLQAIREVVIGIPEEHRELMLRGAKHYNEALDEDGTLVIEILTECMIQDELPEYLSDDVYLGEFSSSYADEYEKLVRDVNLNRHFGYNITDDLPNGTGVDFIKFVRDEFERGESMTFAATILSSSGENVFVGEGTLFGFDGRGSAALSFRVLPEYQRRGYGRKIFIGLVGIAGGIGVDTLFGEVMKENTASLALVRHFSSSESDAKSKFNFKFDVKGLLENH